MISLKHFEGLERKVKIALNELSPQQLRDICDFMGIDHKAIKPVDVISRDLVIERIMSAMKK
jgi:hypothetical protein